MALTDRIDLRAAIRDLSGFTTEMSDNLVDRWIDLAENDLNRRLRVLDRQETSDVVIAFETLEVPSGFRGVVDLYLATSPRTRVRRAAEDQVRVMQAVRSSGPPRFYAVLGDSDATNEGRVLVFGPIPDTTYSGHLTYWKAFTVDDTAGEEMLERWSDAWFYGSLIHGAVHEGDGRRDEFERMYLEAVAGIIAEDNETRYGVEPVAPA